MNKTMSMLETLFAQHLERMPQMHHKCVRAKRSAWQKFCSIGLPSRRLENWKYTRKNLLAFDSYIEPKSIESKVEKAELGSQPSVNDAINFVFRNGVLAECNIDFDELPEGLKITSLSKDLCSASPVGNSIRSTFSSLEGAEDNLQSLNYALASEGLVIEVEAETKLSRPVHITYLTITEPGTQSTTQYQCSPFHFVKLGKNAKLHLIESSTKQTKEAEQPVLRGDVLSFQTVEILQEEGSHLVYECTQSSGKGLKQLQFLRVAQKKASCFESFNILAGQNYLRNDVDVWQVEEHAEASLNGLYAGGDQDICEQRSSIHHLASHGKSTQYYKGILTGEARGIFLGEVRVGSGIEKVAAKQLNKNLLLSDTAEIDTRPQLQIDSDDVRCAHGATVSQLRPEELFYFESRGITLSNAKALMQKAFANEIIRQAPSKESRASWNQHVQNRLTPLTTGIQQ